MMPRPLAEAIRHNAERRRVFDLAQYRARELFAPEEVLEGRAAIEAAGGNADLHEHRLGVRQDGVYCLLVRRPLIHPLPHPNAPWDKGFTMHHPLASLDEWHLVADGLALLDAPDGPEAELQRRARLMSEHEARMRAEIAKREDAAAIAEANAEIARQQRVEFRADDWDRLSTTEQFAYALAMLHDDHDQPELAAAIRQLVATGFTRHTRGEGGRAVKWKPRQWWR